MKPDIIRQPLLLAIASILVVIAAAMTTGTTISPAPETMISTPLGDLIGLFQDSPAAPASFAAACSY